MQGATSNDELTHRLSRLLDVGLQLSSERHIDRLLEVILEAAQRLTLADGGTLYRTAPDGASLRFAIVRNNSLGIAYGGPGKPPVPAQFHDLPLRADDGSPNERLVATYAANRGCTVNIADAYTAQGFDFSGTRAFDARTGYRSMSFLTVPMRNHAGDLIGVLQLLNAIDPVDGSVQPFSDEDRRVAEALASQAAVALTNRLLIDQLAELFESFIRLINVAIDEKSPYTGGHCERVPELTMMLAHAVNETQDGPLAALRLTEQDFYELRIAALLHDCGKITTPVHVVDKATKLQTLFDRIQLVDTRFELIRAQAEAACWQAAAQGERTPEQARDESAAMAAQIRSDRDFLRQANIGGERMSDDDMERVRTIAQRYSWTDMDGNRHPALSEDEVYNLTVRAGTLTAEERQIINDHIVMTIHMLEQLPWPKHLRNVPEYAGGHHERMDGKGYPKGLTREQMSWQARMMGIADIFEALTAHDRPYKKAMTLSEALRIMDKFKDNGHIDPDLYEVFVRQQVYRRYAERYLAAEQVDL